MTTYDDSRDSKHEMEVLRLTVPTEDFFSRFVQQFLFAKLFRACGELMVGENNSRIAAMQSAERNIDYRIAEAQPTKIRDVERLPNVH